MNVERLQRMITLLERDAANPKGVKFDLGRWAAPVGRIAYADLATAAPKVSCDTTACAMGLAAISGEFKAEGMSFSFQQMFDGNYQLIPTFEEHEGFGAAVEFFGIKYGEATFLFDPENYTKQCRQGAKAELVVADRIKSLIAMGYADRNREDYPDEFDGDEDGDD